VTRERGSVARARRLLSRKTPSVRGHWNVRECRGRIVENRVFKRRHLVVARNSHESQPMSSRLIRDPGGDSCEPVRVHAGSDVSWFTPRARRPSARRGTKSGVCCARRSARLPTPSETPHARPLAQLFRPDTLVAQPKKWRSWRTSSPQAFRCLANSLQLLNRETYTPIMLKPYE
jgi:hypothetical protein